MTAAAERRAPAAEERGPGAPAGLVPFVPAALGLALCMAWAWSDGGYFGRDWYPGGLAAAALLVTVGCARLGRRGAWARGVALPLALLAALAAWHGLSLLWSDARGSAWEATNELLAVLAVVALIASAPWRTGGVWLVLGLWGAGICAMAAVDLIGFAGEARPEARLLESRYVGPLGYANGTAALAAMSAWPLLLLSARPATPLWARAAAFPGAVLLIGWSLLPQSRGTLGALVVMAAVAVALSRERARVGVRVLAVAALAALAAGPAWDVYSASREARPLGPVVDDAVRAIAVSVAIAVLISLALLAIEAALRDRSALQRALRRAGWVVAGATAVAVIALTVVYGGRAADGVRDRWEVFSGPPVENLETGARIGQAVADKRADYWDVALDGFAAHPVAGVGAGGFERLYTQNKAYAKHSRYAHNIWLAELSEGGMVGLALLLAALAALWGGLVRRRAADAELVAATVVLSAGFFLQCSVDWLDEVPALLAMALWAPLAALAATAPRRAAGRAGPVAMIALGVAVAASLALPYVAVRYVDRGIDEAATEPNAALQDYDRAAAADPLTIQPLLRKGFLALRLRRPAEARAAFEDVLEREDHWVARFELGLLDARAARFAAALASMERAAELNRNDTLLLDAMAEVRERKRLDPLAVNARVLAEPVLAAP